MRFFILFLICMPLSVSGKDVEITLYVDDAYRPFSFAENGMAKGIYIDVLNAAFSKIEGFQVVLEPVPWNRGKKIMAQGEGIGLAPVFFHGHDWPYLYPYSLPFYTETIIAVCNQEVLKRPKPNWPEDYMGLSIGNVAGFDGWGGDEFWDLVEEQTIYYQEVQSSEALIKMIIKERLDCIMMESLAFDYELQRLRASGLYDENSDIKFAKGARIGADPVYIGYSEPARNEGKYPYADEFQKALDVAIYQMTKSGEITKIINAYEQ